MPVLRACRTFVERRALQNGHPGRCTTRTPMQLANAATHELQMNAAGPQHARRCGPTCFGPIDRQDARVETRSNTGDSGNKMRNFLHMSLLGLVACLALALGPRPSAAAEQRFALVVGNSQYKTGTLATPANDAGLVADALQAAGFTVTGARDLDQATLRESFREFLGQVAAAGPDAVALIYLAGIGLQFQ